MKSFFNLNKCQFDPDIALGRLDGIPIDLDSKEEALLPSYGSFIEMSEEAGSLLELSTASKTLGCPAVRVLRVPCPPVPWGSIEPGFYGILNEYGYNVVCLADPTVHGSLAVPELLEQFVISVNQLFVSTATPILQLVAYMVAARELGLSSDYSPLVFNLAESIANLEPFGTEEQVLRFARTAARDCPSYGYVVGFMGDLDRWLQTQVESGVKDADLSLALVRDDPFVQWRGLPALHGVPKPQG